MTSFEKSYEPGSAASLPASFHRFVKVVADRDSEALLDLFAANASVNDWGQLYRGPDAIRDWNETEFLGADLTLAIDSVVSVDGRVTMRASVNSRHYTGPSTIALVTDAEDRLRELLITS